jgi:hypothetical protein
VGVNYTSIKTQSNGFLNGAVLACSDIVDVVVVVVVVVVVGVLPKRESIRFRNDLRVLGVDVRTSHHSSVYQMSFRHNLI